MWHTVEKWLQDAAEHSTLIGKMWTTFFFVLRMLMVVSIADTIFKDEQEKFVCNTKTPGCKNICYNDFSPISLLRFWALQLTAVAIPPIVFLIYTAHKMDKIKQAKKIRKEEQEKEKKKERKKNRAIIDHYSLINDHPPAYTNNLRKDDEVKTKTKKEEKKKKDEDEKVVASKLDPDTPPRLMIAYIAQILFRLVLEILFVVIQCQIYVFKFWIPELFKCSRFPCPNVVDCFVSKPKEKTVMLWVMFGTSFILIVLGILELYHLGFGKMAEAWQNRDQDITKTYKLKNNMPSFGGYGRSYGGRYPGGYPQAVGIRVGYARSSISGEDSNLDEDPLFYR